MTAQPLINFPFAAEPLAPAVGLEITGIDLTALDDATTAALHDAFLAHHVLVIRDQTLTPAQQLAFAERMGDPDIYPFVTGLDGFPMITPVVKEAHETVNFGGIWHSDTAYLETPPKATMLFARQIPPAGGDTLFASQVAAYEALSEAMKTLLAPLNGVNSSAKADASKTREDRLSGDRAREVLEAVHPVVRVHSETGKKALYVNVGHTARLDGFTAAESKPILDYLFAHQIRPEFQCRVRWREGTLVLWDNRAVQHYPVNDYHGFRREMHRVTLKG